MIYVFQSGHDSCTVARDTHHRTHPDPHCPGMSSPAPSSPDPGERESSADAAVEEAPPTEGVLDTVLDTEGATHLQPESATQLQPATADDFEAHLMDQDLQHVSTRTRSQTQNQPSGSQTSTHAGPSHDNATTSAHAASVPARASSHSHGHHRHGHGRGASSGAVSGRGPYTRPISKRSECKRDGNMILIARSLLERGVETDKTTLANDIVGLIQDIFLDAPANRRPRGNSVIAFIEQTFITAAREIAQNSDQSFLIATLKESIKEAVKIVNECPTNARIPYMTPPPDTHTDHDSSTALDETARRPGPSAAEIAQRAVIEISELANAERLEAERLEAERLEAERLARATPQVLDQADQARTVPQALDQARTEPQALDQARTVPQALDQARTEPQAIEQPHIESQVLDQPQIGPQVLEQAQNDPLPIEQPQIDPQAADNAHIEQRPTSRAAGASPRMIRLVNDRVAAMEAALAEDAAMEPALAEDAATQTVPTYEEAIADATRHVRELAQRMSVSKNTHTIYS